MPAVEGVSIEEMPDEPAAASGEDSPVVSDDEPQEGAEAEEEESEEDALADLQACPRCSLQSETLPPWNPRLASFRIPRLLRCQQYWHTPGKSAAVTPRINCGGM